MPEALLRLEMAADVHTCRSAGGTPCAAAADADPPQHPSPQQTWGQDVATVLGSASDEASARRLQTALKQLLRK
jgi:hypothetical protein